LIAAHSLVQDRASALPQTCASWSSTVAPGQVAGKIQHTPWLEMGVGPHVASALKLHRPPLAVHAVASSEEQVSVVLAVLTQAPVLLELAFCPFECSRHESW